MSSPFLGEIRMVAFETVPTNWKACDGELLPIASNEDLFSILGTFYGGDGVNNFALPDFRGRLPVGATDIEGNFKYRTGFPGGKETAIVAMQHLPSHRHRFGTGLFSVLPLTGSGRALASGLPLYHTLGPELVGFASNSIVDKPGHTEGASHDNMGPSLAIRFIICVEGTIPTPTRGNIVATQGGYNTSATLTGSVKISGISAETAQEDLGYKLEVLISAVNLLSDHVSTMNVAMTSAASTIAGASLFSAFSGGGLTETLPAITNFTN